VLFVLSDGEEWRASLLVLIGTSLLLAAPAARAVAAPGRALPARAVARVLGSRRRTAVRAMRASSISGARCALAAVPARLVVHVSADNRYLLHVNGRRAWARGRRARTCCTGAFESYDIAPFLRAGENRVAATVWNFGTLSRWRR
jgi:hypothetical protein